MSRRLAAELNRRSTETRELTPGQKRIALDFEISREAERRRQHASTQADIEAAGEWERKARRDAGLPIKGSTRLTREEIDGLPRHIRALGIKSGFLYRNRHGQLVEVEDRQ